MKNLLTIFVLIATTFYCKAQTIEETVDYIKLKTANSSLWYTSSDEVTTISCDAKYKYYFSDITSFSYSDNSMIFFNKCSGDVGSLMLFWDKIKSVEMIEENGKKNCHLNLFLK